MSLEDTTYQLIDQYLQGELPESHPFVLRLKQDEELALEVEVRRSIQDAVVDYRLLEVEKLLVSKRKELKEAKPAKWNRLLWALPVLLLATLAYYYPSPSKQEVVVESATTSVAESPVPPSKVEPQITQEVPTREAKNLVPKRTLENKEIKAQEKESEIELPTIREPSPIVLPTNLPPTASVVAPQKEEPKTHVEANVTIPNPCVGIRLKAFIEEKRPCIGTSQGQLDIKQARGGKAPYQYSLDGKSFHEESYFTGLKSGEYTLVIKDANSCETVVYENYPLKSQSCTSFSEQVFNPNFGPWEVPTNKEKWGTLSVLDLNGQTIYTRNFDKAEKLTWAGIQNRGELLVPGAYIYSIKYSDGEVEQGKITITY